MRQRDAWDPPVVSRSDHEIAAQEGGGLRCRGLIEKIGRRRRVSHSAPRTRTITSPASLRTWPRSCEAITILMPRSRRRVSTISSTPRWRRDRDWRSARRATALPDRAPARGPAPAAAVRRRTAAAPAAAPGRSSPTALEQVRRCAPARSCARHARLRQRIARRWRRRCGAASPGAETGSRAAPVARSARPPQVMRPADGASSPMHSRSKRGLARAVRPDDQRRRTGRDRQDTRSRIVVDAGLQRDVIRTRMEDRLPAPASSARLPFDQRRACPRRRVDRQDDGDQHQCPAPSPAADRPWRSPARSPWSWCG